MDVAGVTAAPVAQLGGKLVVVFVDAGHRLVLPAVGQVGKKHLEGEGFCTGDGHMRVQAESVDGQEVAARVMKILLHLGDGGQGQAAGSIVVYVVGRLRLYLDTLLTSGIRQMWRRRRSEIVHVHVGPSRSN